MGTIVYVRDSGKEHGNYSISRLMKNLMDTVIMWGISGWMLNLMFLERLQLVKPKLRLPSDLERVLL